MTDLGGLSDPKAPVVGGDEAGALPDGGPASSSDAAIDGPPEPAPGPPTWRLAASAGPSARHSTALGYDQTRQRVIVFGGHVTDDLGDTWEWDGTTWSQRTLPDSPSSRRGHRMVWDEAHKVVFMFGGTRPAIPDQWAWDGVRWRAKTSANHPPSFQSAVMAYDAARAVTVMFGGHHYPPDGGASFSRNETWEWNGADWAQRNVTVHPSARRAQAMAYDSARQRIVVFSGRAVGGATPDTWEYDGTNWLEREPIDVPSARYGACAAYDPRRRIVVMFGGANEPATYDDTWHWDGTNWTPGPKGPPPLRSCAMAWDPARRAIVMFGGTLGETAGGRMVSSQTWVYE